MYKWKTTFHFSDQGPLLGLRTLSHHFTSHHPISKLKKIPQIEYGFESKWIYFVWCSVNSFSGIGTPFCQDPKSGASIFLHTTHNVFYSRKNFKIKNILIHWLSHTPPTMLSPLPISGIILERSGPCYHRSAFRRRQPWPSNWRPPDPTPLSLCAIPPYQLLTPQSRPLFCSAPH